MLLLLSVHVNLDCLLLKLYSIVLPVNKISISTQKAFSKLPDRGCTKQQMKLSLLVSVSDLQSLNDFTLFSVLFLEH